MEKKTTNKTPKKQTARKPKTLWEKIQATQQGVKTVLKLGYNNFQNYKYIQERDIIAEIKPILGQNGLYISTSLKDLEYDKETGIAQVLMEFRIVDIETGERELVLFPGAGQDLSKTGKPGDKAIPKALTMATKYFLSKYFLIETGDDAEKDTHQDKNNAKKGGSANATTEEQYKKAEQMIKTSNNIEGLIEWDSMLQKNKTYSKEQKEKLSVLISMRVDYLSNKNDN